MYHGMKWCGVQEQCNLLERANIPLEWASLNLQSTASSYHLSNLVTRILFWEIFWDLTLSGAQSLIAPAGEQSSSAHSGYSLKWEGRTVQWDLYVVQIFVVDVQ